MCPDYSEFTSFMGMAEKFSKRGILGFYKALFGLHSIFAAPKAFGKE